MSFIINQVNSRTEETAPSRGRRGMRNRSLHKGRVFKHPPDIRRPCASSYSSDKLTHRLKDARRVTHSLGFQQTSQLLLRGRGGLSGFFTRLTTHQDPLGPAVIKQDACARERKTHPQIARQAAQ